MDTTAGAPAHFERFTELPRELRIEILRLAICSKRRVFVDFRPYSNQTSCFDPALDLRVMLVCKVVCEDALAALYENVTFRVLLRMDSNFPSFRNTPHLGFLRHARHLQLYMSCPDTVGQHFWLSTRMVVNLLKRNQNLCTLELIVDLPFLPTKNADHAMALFEQLTVKWNLKIVKALNQRCGCGISEDCKDKLLRLILTTGRPELAGY